MKKHTTLMLLCSLVAPYIPYIKGAEPDPVQEKRWNMLKGCTGVMVGSMAARRCPTPVINKVGELAARPVMPGKASLGNVSPQIWFNRGNARAFGGEVSSATFPSNNNNYQPYPYNPNLFSNPNLKSLPTASSFKFSPVYPQKPAPSPKP